VTYPLVTLWFHQHDDRDRSDASRVLDQSRALPVVADDSVVDAFDDSFDGVRAALAADEERAERALNTLFQTHASELVRYATSLVRTRALAEEVVQDAFFTLWTHRESLQARGNLRAYLFGIVRHRSVDLVRRDRVEERVTERFDLPSAVPAHEDAESADLDRRVRASMQALSPRVREVITLRLRDELTYAEIAEILGVSVKTIEAQMSSALRRLRTDLADLRDPSAS